MYDNVRHHRITKGVFLTCQVLYLKKNVGYYVAKFIRGICSILSTLLTLALLALAVSLAGVRLLGYIPYSVISGSMTPTYCVGDLVYAKHAEFNEISVGDPITFLMNDSGLIVTHRVIAVDTENQWFYTQGDANTTPDGSPVPYQNVIGVVRFSIPKLGFVSDYISSPSGHYAAIGVLCVLGLMVIIPMAITPSSSGKNKPVEQV